MTPDEMLRKNQRALNKAMRELDRERAKMEQQEKKIIADIKKMAKQGQMDAVKIMAKVGTQIELVFLFKTIYNCARSLSFLILNPISGPCPHPTLHKEVHVDEGQHPGRFTEDPDHQVSKLYGPGHEGSHEGHAEHEQADEASRDTEDHDGV